MPSRWFGTDGIRGQVGRAPMTPDFCLSLGAAAGRVFGEGSTVLIGKDTRISGYLFESVLEAGLVSSGVNVLLLGPMPTPAIAYLTRAFRAEGGIVISASHNPFHDNGIKFFDGHGEKLASAVEASIERELDAEPTCLPAERLGKAWRVDDALGRYIEYCKARVGLGVSLRGLKLVVDAAHGACYQAAPAVMSELGGEVTAIGDQPNGMNINLDCGSVYPQALAEQTKATGADFGLALDGDGDRVIMADATGRIYDGDALVYALARHKQRRGQLGGGVVMSEMSNLGLGMALDRLGIASESVPVGDRQIQRKLVSLGWSLGGEPAGHLLMLDLAPTGDGILAALQVMQAAVLEEKSLAELCQGYEPLPSVLRNVPVASPKRAVSELGACGALNEAKSALGSSGRLLVRPSGTEDLVRILIEGPDMDVNSALADALEKKVLAT